MKARIQAKDIGVYQFVTAAKTAYEQHRFANVWNVAAILNVPVKVVMAKLGKLKRQNIMEGCNCGCGSPMWLIDPEDPPQPYYPPTMVEWRDTATVDRVIERYAPKEVNNGIEE